MSSLNNYVLVLQIFLNEFLGYIELGILIEDRKALQNHISNNGTFLESGRDIILVSDNSTTLVGGVIEVTTTSKELQLVTNTL